MNKVNISGLVLEKGNFIIHRKNTPRKNWDKAFKRMHKNGDDKLLMGDIYPDEYFKNWKFTQ